MKNLFKMIAVLIIAVLATGCASTSGFNPGDTEAGRITGKRPPHENAVTRTAAGAAFGGALQILGVKNAAGAGALIGLASGISKDARIREDERIAAEVRSTGTGNYAADARGYDTKANKSRAMQIREECRRIRAELAGTRSINEVPECYGLSNYALDNMTDEQINELVFQAETGGRGAYPYTFGSSIYRNGVRRGSPHEAYWSYWNTIGAERYNRANGWYQYRGRYRGRWYQR